MTEEPPKKSKTLLWVVIGLILGIMLLSSLGMVNITVLDPQPFENITLQINITT